MIISNIEHSHVTRSFQDFKRGKHRTLQSHHLFWADEVITPDLDDLTLELFKRRAIIEKTLDGTIRLETLPQENLTAQQRFESSSVKGLALLSNVVGGHGGYVPRACIDNGTEGERSWWKGFGLPLWGMELPIGDLAQVLEHINLFR
jgi:hypothetical protein